MHRTPWPAACLAALLSFGTGAALAQPGPGWGPGGPRFGPDDTPGWNMMSPQERDAFHERLRRAQTPGECRRLMDEHRRWMEQRAGGRGHPMRPRHDPCAAMRG